MLWAAEQHFEEAPKGLLQPGMLANRVILEGDPLTALSNVVKDMKVVETIKEGIGIYPAL